MDRFQVQEKTSRIFLCSFGLVPAGKSGRTATATEV
jgi:hypothetical protein